MSFPPPGIRCPRCNESNPSDASACAKCSTPFSLASDVTQIIGEGWSPPSSAQVFAGSGLHSAADGHSAIHPPTADAFNVIAPGTVLNARYEVVALLGQGGMGAVYKANDIELERPVALKVIRPDLAGQPEIIERFKHELILARQITHRNVIRLFDLGSAGSLKFITMELINGESLNDLTGHKRLSIVESVSIVRQIASALEAAHSEDVIHRDLKPQNIMVDAAGKVTVMDFGLARSVTSEQVTQAGVVLGTPNYMSPEQVHGTALDARSDLFALGVIFYELITSKAPYAAETTIATLVKRTQELPPAPNTVIPEIPQRLSDIVMRCLAINRDARYATASDLVRELDDFTEGRSSPALLGVEEELEPPAPPVRKRPRWSIAAVSLALAALTAGVLFRDRFTRPRQMPVRPVAVLVSDFVNSTGDPVFDGTLEPMLNFAVERAGFITTYNRAQARSVAAELGYSANKLDTSTARLIAVRQGVQVVISGSLTRASDGYSVSTTAIDANTGKQLASSTTNASSKEEVLAQVPKLVAPIRNALGDVTPESSQLSAVETFTAGNVAAAHEYAVAQDLMFNAQYEKAKEGFAKAVQLDPNFGRAYASMAVASLNLGQRDEGEKYFKLAMTHLDRMTERERFRTRGAYYIMTGNDEKCVEEYTALVTQFPSDPAGHNNLALCQVHRRMLPDALTQIKRAVDISPGFAMLRNNLALFSAYSGDGKAAEEHARATQKLNPKYAKSFISAAFGAILNGRPADAAATYQKLATLGPKQNSTAQGGLGDLAIYEGRFDDGIKLLEGAAADDLKANDKEAAARKYIAIANARSQQQQKRAAITAAENALQNSSSTKVTFLAARILAANGDLSRARSLVGKLASSTEVEPEAYARIVEGNVALAEGNARQAISKFTEANKMLNTWIGHYDLGRAYLENRQFGEAVAELDQCIRRKGEALALFLDEVSTFAYFPPALYQLGRAREQARDSAFAKDYNAYLAIRGKAEQDPVAAEISTKVKP